MIRNVDFNEQHDANVFDLLPRKSEKMRLSANLKQSILSNETGENNKREQKKWWKL